MTVLEDLIDGLEQWLEVERECGVRTLEVDRSLIAAHSITTAPESTATSPAPKQEQKPQPKPAAPAAVQQNKLPQPAKPTAQSSAGSKFDFVFLHDRPLDQAGEEMMGKIVFAMGKTPETAPVIIDHPVPNARAYVVLGARALKKFFPENKAEPGQWIKSALGKDVLVTYSPAFLLRFPVVTKSVQKMKHDMWLNLKDLARRLK